MSFDGVMLTVLAVLVGLFVGFARRGRVLSMARTDLRARSLLVIGIIVPALAEQFTREMAVPLVVAGMVALFAFALRNVRLAGMSVLAIGVLANLLPTFLNNGLPVRRDALVEAGIVERDELDRVEVRGARRLEEPTQQLRFLGDVIALPETRQVLSFGDLIVLVGLADVTANLTRMRRRRRGEEPVEDDLATELDTDPVARSAESAEQLEPGAYVMADDLDEDDLPTVDDYLAVAIRSHVDRGAPFDPRPSRRRVDTTAVAPDDEDPAWAIEPELVEAADDDGTDEIRLGRAPGRVVPAEAVIVTGATVHHPDDDPPPGGGAREFDEAVHLPSAVRWGPEVVWWTSESPPPAPPDVIDLRHDGAGSPIDTIDTIDHQVEQADDPEDAWGDTVEATAEADTEPLDTEPLDDAEWDHADTIDDAEWDDAEWDDGDLVDADADADADADDTDLTVRSGDPEPWQDELLDDELLEDEQLEDELLEDELLEDHPLGAWGTAGADPLPIGVASGGLDDLVVLANAPADELLRAFVGDLRSSRRSRRRGRRHIPDFEPIHLDDDLLTPR